MKQTYIDELNGIQDFLQQECEKSPDVYVERLRLLNTFLARTGVLLAIAKYELASEIGKIYETEEEKIKSFTPTQTKEYIKGKTATASFYVDWCDRMNSNCVHQAENLRTLLSYEKAQMQFV